jgi:hypothetical protein
MPKSDGSPLDPIEPEAFDGNKYSIQLEPTDHKHVFTKISSNEIRCNCGVGFSGSNIDTLLKLFDKRK